MALAISVSNRSISISLTITTPYYQTDNIIFWCEALSRFIRVMNLKNSIRSVDNKLAAKCTLDKSIVNTPKKGVSSSI